jgi:hypothetical protein
MELDLVLIFLFPLKNRRRLVPLCVVRDEVYAPPSVLPNELFEEFQVRRGVEDFHKSEMELGTRADANRANHLDTCPAGKALHLRSDSSACPVPINGTGLSEQNLIFIQQHAVLPPGFFLLPEALS